jgi:hypothetical protein
MRCSVAEASAATLREMNPLVRIEALPGDISEEPDTNLLREFDVVLLPQAPVRLQLEYDKACTEVNTAFFTACSRGTVAYFFENLHVHEHTPMVRCLHALRLACRRKQKLQSSRLKLGNDPEAMQGSLHSIACKASGMIHLLLHMLITGLHHLAHPKAACIL